MRFTQGQSLLSLVAPAVVGALLCGCPNPNIYGTARTIPQGQLQHTVAIEAFGGAGGRTDSVYPTLPTYQLRYGLSDRMDLGVRLANLTSIGADLKINFVRGFIDLAVDPGFTGTYVAVASEGESASVAVFWLNAPLLVGINFSDSVSLLLSPGIGALLGGGGGTTSTSSGSSSVYSTGSAGYARLGVGFNFRVSNGFAVQPEFTAIKPFSFDGVIFSLGLGFSFGSTPRPGIY